MKNAIYFILTVCSLAVIGQGCGSGDSNTSRNDPTYSTHNYKHPNKADSARKWERKPGVLVSPPGKTNASNAKHQVPNQTPVGGITVNHTPSTDVANRNYKIQRPSQSTGTAVAGKRKNRSNTGPMTGH